MKALLRAVSDSNSWFWKGTAIAAALAAYFAGMHAGERQAFERFERAAEAISREDDVAACILDRWLEEQHGPDETLAGR